MMTHGNDNALAQSSTPTPEEVTQINQTLNKDRRFTGRYSKQAPQKYELVASQRGSLSCGKTYNPVMELKQQECRDVL
jgi:hypothetical protein